MNALKGNASSMIKYEQVWGSDPTAVYEVSWYVGESLEVPPGYTVLRREIKDGKETVWVRPPMMLVSKKLI